jgi:predicted DNA-binding transcriptional regulator AlpA
MAAAYLGISERMLDHVRQRADFPQPIKLGRRTLWDRKALDQFVDELSNQHDAELWAAIVAAG